MLGAYFGGLESLPLILHETLLGFFRFWEVLVEHFHCYQWPGQVVPVADTLDPRGFGWEPCRCMDILDCALYTWVLVDIVDLFR